MEKRFQLTKKLRFGPAHLRSRLMLWGCLMLIGMALFIMVVYSLFEYRSVKLAAFNRLDEAVTAEAAYLDKWMEDRLGDIEGLSVFPTLRSESKAFIEEALFTVKNTRADFMSVSFVNNRGMIEFSTTSAAIGQDVQMTEFYQEGLNGRVYVSNAKVTQTGEVPVIVFSSPVYDYDRRFTGVVTGVVAVERMDSLLERPHTATAATTFVVDNGGRLIVPPANADDRARLALFYNTGLLPDTTGLIGNPVNYEYRNFEDKKVYAAVEPIRGGLWYVIGETDKDAALLHLFNNVVWLSLFVLLVLSLMVVFVHKFASRIERPVTELLRGVHLLRQGNYNYRIDDAAFAGTSIELIEICRAFNEMSSTIHHNMQQIYISEQRYRSLFDYNIDAVFSLDMDGRFVSANRAASTHFGLKMEELIGQSFLVFIDAKEHERLIDVYHQVKGGQPTQQELMITRRDSTQMDAIVSVVPIFVDGKVVGTYGLMKDVTEQKQSERALLETNLILRRMSGSDGLTGLSNRRLFDEAYEQAWEECGREGKPLSLIVFDIDSFKIYNDTYGHLKGDECLKHVADVLQQLFRGRKDCLVARYGGEEFVVLAPGQSWDFTAELAERIRSRIVSLKIPHEFTKASTNVVTISAGVASTFPGLAVTPDVAEQARRQLFQQADEALYRSKTTRNKVTIYGEG
ncbi:sensor domain-containing diguanylate cyclase [Paenibacillus turpanensis]|uniref:sensor domain-containing diguanylate cyclase n=1 Tax=Paenibacillus turpanensis TaxID=2689078 RepID=UPI00140C525F|nr:diguanylate cyclase [Paenibacillus turpanensis]